MAVSMRAAVGGDMCCYVPRICMAYISSRRLLVTSWVPSVFVGRFHL